MMPLRSHLRKLSISLLYFFFPITNEILLYSDDNTTDIFEDLDVEADIKESVTSYIKRKLAPQPVKIRADIEVTCFAYDGIDAIKEALTAGEAHGVTIKLIAAPIYVMTQMTLDKEHGIETMNQAIETIGNVIRAKG